MEIINDLNILIKNDLDKNRNPQIEIDIWPFLNFPSSKFLQFIYTIIIGSGTEVEISRNDPDMEITVPWQIYDIKNVHVICSGSRVIFFFHFQASNWLRLFSDLIIIMAGPALSEDIQTISFHNLRPLYLHGTIGPFCILYLLWFYCWTVIYGVENYFEAGLIALVGIALLQILAMLFCVWSVDLRCWMTCSKVFE